MATQVINREPKTLFYLRQRHGEFTGNQRLFSSIGNYRLFAFNDQNRIERLFRRNIARLFGRSGVARIHIHHQAVKGVIAVPDMLSKTKQGCVLLCHVSDTPEPFNGCASACHLLWQTVTTGFFKPSAIIPIQGVGLSRLLGLVCQGRAPLRTAHNLSRPMPETSGAPQRRDNRSQPPRPRRSGDSGRDAPLYGALDLGTNNCRLLIARPVRDGFRVVDSFSRIVRLGDGLSRTGRLDNAAMDRAYEALALCAERIARKDLKSNHITAVATQACRAASNGAEFIERVRKGTGLNLRIIDPAEEARLSVAGCINLVDPESDAVLVIDVGGGSTELSWLRRNGSDQDTVAWMSVPMGVVTLAERHPEPPDAPHSWYEAMVMDVFNAIASGAPNDPEYHALYTQGRAHMVGTSGAITSLAGIHLGLRRYQRDLVDGLWMTRADCEAAATKLIHLGPHGRAAESCIGPDRADLVLAGAAILEAVQRAWPCERVRVADRGLREGLLLTLMRAPSPAPKKRRRRRRRGRSKGAATSATTPSKD